MRALNKKEKTTVGAYIDVLPSDTVPVIAGSTTYHESDGVNYLSESNDGVIRYKVVSKLNCKFSS